MHHDHLGSVRLVTDPKGNILDSLDFLPFGEQISGTQPWQHKFTSYERDAETNLDNAQARYYGSALGRFMSPDISLLRVIDGDMSVPQSWNLYGYVRNNPLTLTDPNGLDCVYLNDSGVSVESIDQNSNSDECRQNGGYWVDQTANANSFHDYGDGFASMQNTNGISYSFCTGGDCSQPPSFAMGGLPPNDAISRDPVFDFSLLTALGGVPALARGGASLLGDLVGMGARTTATTLTQSAAGDIIGWGTGQAGAAATRQLTQTLTRETVKEMIAKGLTREMVQQLADKYGAALAEGGAKLANTQLQPRLELMRKILELWPTE